MDEKGPGAIVVAEWDDEPGLQEEYERNSAMRGLAAEVVKIEEREEIWRPSRPPEHKNPTADQRKLLLNQDTLDFIRQNYMLGPYDPANRRGLGLKMLSVQFPLERSVGVAAAGRPAGSVSESRGGLRLRLGSHVKLQREDKLD